MPAIDPERLARQIADLSSGSGHPKEIALGARTILEEYADPVRPSVPSVPAPVLRSIRLALESFEQPVAISESLWKSTAPDSRLLAAGLLGQYREPEVAAIAERRTGQNVLIEIVQELGDRGLSGWRLVDPSGFLEQLERWLNGDRRRRQVLAAYALRGRVRDDDFRDHPSAFGLLKGRLAGPRGELREALVSVVRALADAAPTETMMFLNEERPSPLIKALTERLKSEMV